MNRDGTCGEVLSQLYNVLGALGICAAVGLVPREAYAQISNQQGSEASGPTIEQIVVTAERRSESLVDAPISVLALSEGTLKTFNIISSADLQFVTSGLVIPTDTGVATPAVRGVGSGYSGPGLESSVPVYIDDVYIESQSAQLQSLLDLKQVEVVKGPQGVLYGRNATGGAILLATNNPDPSSFSGHVEGEIGTIGTNREEVVLNVPLSETLALRLAGSHETRGDYIHNIAKLPDAHENVGSYDTDHIRGTIGWTPTTDFTVIGSVDWQQRDQDQVRQQTSAGSLCVTCTIYGDSPANGFYTTTQADLPIYTSKNLIGALRVRYEIGDIELANFTSYQHVKSTGCTDLGLTSTPFLIYCQDPYATSETYTEELRASSHFQGSLNFAMGVFYLENNSFFGSSLGGLAFEGAGPGIGNNKVNTNSFSGYAEGYWDFQPNWKLTVGGRYTVDNRSFSVNNNAFAAAALAGGVVSFSDQATSSGFTPRVVIQYSPGEWNFYASYNRGYKAGGFFLPTFSPINSVGPERIDAFEGGMKTRLADGRVQLNFAYYHYNWKDIQVTQIDPVTSFQSLVNAGAASANGVEAGIQVAVAHGLNVGGNFAWERAVFDKFPAASVLFPTDAGFTGGAENLAGFPLPNAPEFSGDLNVSYAIAFQNDWVVTFNGAERLISRYDFFPGAGGPLRLDQQSGYGLTNIAATVSSPEDKWELTFSINNLTDTKYVYQTGTTGYGVYIDAAEPRIFRVGIRTNF